jgi:hypothetical protein
LQAPFVCLPPSRWFLVLGRRPRTSPRIWSGRISLSKKRRIWRSKGCACGCFS